MSITVYNYCAPVNLEALHEDLLDVLRDVGPQLPELWNAKLLSDPQKKALLRSLIDKVVIHRLAPDQVQTRVV